MFRVENIKAKGEIAHYEIFLLLLQYVFERRLLQRLQQASVCCKRLDKMLEDDAQNPIDSKDSYSSLHSLLFNTFYPFTIYLHSNVLAFSPFNNDLKSASK